MVRGKGEGSLFKDGRGYWTARVELPSYDGTRRSKKVRSKSKAVVIEKMRDMQNELKKRGDLPTRDITVEQWLNEWFTTVCVFEVSPKTSNNYKSQIKNHIVPVIGSKPLEKLTPADIRRMHAAIAQKGLSSTTARLNHRILSGALKVAVSDGRVGRNVAALVSAPRKAPNELTALTLEQGVKVLQAALGDRYEALWWAVLFTGQRAGELCGLETDRVSDSLDISWQLQRLTWQHGCDPWCGRKLGADCRKRKLNHPDDWEGRNIQGGLWLTRPKSSSGWRVIPLVDPLGPILRQHLARTADEPNPHGLVWHTPEGDPIDPRRVQDWWHELLARAGVPQVRFHDGRHTTVDLLLEAGVEKDIIQEIIGHSTWEQTMRYKTRGNKKRLTGGMVQLSDYIMRRVDARSETLALAE